MPVPRDKARAVAIILEGFRDPPHRVPFIAVDLGEPGGISASTKRAQLRHDGFRVVHTVDGEVYPANRDVSYAYTVGRSPYNGELALRRSGQHFHQSVLQVTDAWAELETLTGLIVIAIGTAGFSDLPSDPSSVVDRLRSRLSEGAFVGATIARDPNEREEPLFPPASWLE